MGGHLSAHSHFYYYGAFPVVFQLEGQPPRWSAPRGHPPEPASAMSTSLLTARRQARLVGLLALVFLGACGLSEPDGTQVVFEGTFEALDPEAQVSGDAVAVSRDGRTEMGLSVNGLTPDTEHRWQFRRNQCDETGETLVSPDIYAPFTSDANGTGTALRIIGETLRGDQRYAMEVLDGPVGEGQVLACATLVRVE